MKKIILSFTLSFFSTCLLSGQITAIGPEAQVNTTIANSQQNPAIAMNANGEYVIVWESLNQDGSGYGIYAQHYDNMGVPTGSETLVNSTTNNDQRFPAIAMDDNGNYTIVWQALEQSGGDGWDIYLRRFDNLGAALSGEVRVNTSTSGQQRFSDIAMDDDGDFVVVWESNFDIYQQRYNSSGLLQGSETLVNTTTANAQNYPVVAMDSDGDFVISWQSLSQDGDGYGIYAQSFNADGTVALAEFLVNSSTANNQLSPAIAMDALGNFVISWVSKLQDGDQEGIYAQRFDNTATTLDNEFLVNTTTFGAQDNPSISMTSEGDFIIAWNDYGQDGDRFGIYFKGYDPNGIAISTETLVNSTMNNFQQFAAIGLKSRTRASIVWQDGDRNVNNSIDTDNYTIVQQLYSINIAPAPVELLYFTASLQENQTVLLNWETTNELNNKGFHLERSRDGESWESITFIKGAGTSPLNNNYFYLDKEASQGINYYRLKQMDFDGAHSYSPIRTIVLPLAELDFLKVFPNPTADVLHIELVDADEKLRTIEIYNGSGQLLQRNHSPNLTFSMKNFVSGQYLLVLKTSIRTYQQVLVKE